MSQLLATIKLKLTDIRIANYTGALTVPALQSGALDGGQLVPPFSQLPYVQANLVKLGPLLPSGRIMTLGSTIQSRRPVVQAYARAYLRTIRTYMQGDYRNNPEIANIISSYTGAPLSAVLNQPTPYNFGQKLENVTDLIPQFQALWFKAQREPGAAQILSYSKPIAIKQITDTSIINVVNAELPKT
jgi:NitT/TauT family transport system substrate-binding protein